MPSKQDYPVKETHTYNNGYGLSQDTIFGHTTILHWALEKKYIRLATLLLDKFGAQSMTTWVIGRKTELQLCIQLGYTNLALKMIEKGKDKCNPSNVSRVGNTALILSCCNNMTEVAVKMIETFGLHCIPMQYNNTGHTALMIACKKKMTTVAVKMIKVFGEKCNINRRNTSRMSAIDYAVQNHMDEVVQQLSYYPQSPPPRQCCVVV